MMRRRKRMKSVAELEKAWEAYKQACDGQTVLTHEFSTKMGDFVSRELRRPITYTIEGFCVHAGIVRRRFYDQYAKDEAYADFVERIREECEVDARKKFELELIPARLAGLWMSHYGYTTNTCASIEGGVPVIICGGDALED